MLNRSPALAIAGLIAILFSRPASSAQPPAPTFSSLSPLAFDTTLPVIRAHAEPQKPFTISGERGALLGQQDGTLEAWVLPVKLLSHLTLQAEIEGYTAPIQVNQQAAEIEVRPDRTVITYAHIGFTVRQIMFSPAGAPAGTGPVVLFEFDCLHPTDFTFRFTPELRWMWPERNEGTPSVEWVAPGPNPHEVPGGFYVLHSDYPDLAGAVTIPGARPGILAPYQERPQAYPAELKLHIDPARDRGRLFPLLMAAGMDKASTNSGVLGALLERLNTTIAASYAAHEESYKKLLANSVSIETPDSALNEAFQWAVISIEQLKVKAQATNETALVAGYFASGDSARPGFGWFFGRDALYTLFAVNSYGNFGLSKSELEFLIRRQRADGKIMHEYSQTAAAIDWQAFSYMYAAADATPLFLLAVADYVKASGDVAFLKEHRGAVQKAWEFETAHAPDAAHGGNGIYDNTQGTGWVENWLGGLPHQEIYLALLDQQASGATAKIEELLGDKPTAAAARQRAAAVAKTINAQFHDREKGCYAFSRNAGGSLDRTTTVYPALDWWSGAPILDRPGECLQQFASHTMQTDWGLRDLSSDEKVYDGMSYHQGSVWPLFTGWGALAEYRGGQPLAGHRMLMENANLTHAQDLGAVTELLSGDYFVPFGRSTSHQLWSSAMVVTPALRGLFGIDVDAQTRTITVNPHLPASWDHAEVLNLQIPGGSTALYFAKRADRLEIYGSGEWKLRSDMPGATIGPLQEDLFKKLRIPPHTGLRVPLPAVEIDDVEESATLAEPVAVATPNRPPLPGATTAKFRVLHSEYGERKLMLTFEGLAGSDGVMRLLRHGRFAPTVETSPASDAATAAGRQYASISYRSCDADPYACTWLPLLLHFPDGEGWKTLTVTLTW